jgi:hypothetical protein
VGVLAGTEHEELFDESANPVGVRDNHSGEVSGFAPPGDIHRIRNDGGETAISCVEALRTAPSLCRPPPTTPSIRGGDRS